MKLKTFAAFVKKNLKQSKAENIVVLDVKSLTTSFDMMFVCTGTSTRHVQSISKKLIDAVKEMGVRPLGVEGETYAEWILIDLHDVIVHVMLKSQRELYQLEKLWTVTEHFKKKKTACMRINSHFGHSFNGNCC